MKNTYLLVFALVIASLVGIMLLAAACEYQDPEGTQAAVQVRVAQQIEDDTASWTKIGGGLYYQKDAINGNICYKYNASIDCLPYDDDY